MRPIIKYVLATIKIVLLGREEFVKREFDAFKQVAGVVVGSGYAFLLRDTEIKCRNQQLHIPLQFDNREQAHGGEYTLIAAWGNEFIVKAAAYEIGDTADVVTV